MYFSIVRFCHVVQKQVDEGLLVVAQVLVVKIGDSRYFPREQMADVAIASNAVIGLVERHARDDADSHLFTGGYPLRGLNDKS